MTHQSKRLRGEIEVSASRYQLDPDLIEAIVRQESSGFCGKAYRYEPAFYTKYLADDQAYDGADPRRVSASYGPMQIMYPTARDNGFKDSPEYLFVPTIGIEEGCKQFAKLLRHVNADTDRALAAYNGGLGGSRRPFRPEIARYVSSVKTHLQSIKEGN